MSRSCSGCTLCCKLLPMSAQARPQARRTVALMIATGLLDPFEVYGSIEDFDKPAGKPCPHQRHGKGCAIYNKRPFGCRMWECRWLTGEDTAELRRPDRSGYVIDCAPDYVTTEQGNTLPVVQVWVDPGRRDAWRDPELLEFVKRRWIDGMGTLIRWNAAADCMFLWVDDQGNVQMKTSNLRGERPHTAQEKAAALGPMMKLVGEEMISEHELRRRLTEKKRPPDDIRRP